MTTFIVFHVENDYGMSKSKFDFDLYYVHPNERSNDLKNLYLKLGWILFRTCTLFSADFIGSFGMLIFLFSAIEIITTENESLGNKMYVV